FYVEKRLRLDFDGLVELAAPVDVQLRERAEDAAKEISEEFELILASPDIKDSNNELFSWIRGGATIDREKELYDYFDMLLQFVSKRIRRPNYARGPHSLHPKRTIDAFEKHDVKVEGSEQSHRLDIVVECTPIGQSSVIPVAPRPKNPRYENLFTAVEAKKTNSKTEVGSACAQLLVYMRETYVTQWNRRFIWGLTMCRDAIRVYSFGNDHLLGSKDMRLTERDGRTKFIQLLVNWSFCEEHRLGYDPTMIRLPELRCWQIEVPALPETVGEQTSATSKYFYTRCTIAAADHLFGRHTRTFLATNNKPTCVEDTDSKNCKYVIKDSWVESTHNADDDMRDEAKHLHKIHKRLGKFEDVKGCYPTIIAGGRIRLNRSDSSEAVDDTTASILGDLFNDVAVPLGDSSSENSSNKSECSNLAPFRVHKRIATAPVGKPLRHLDCPLKLIKVMADVMRVHGRMRWDADILHRDISTNNVLFYETDDGQDVCGLLIDFDHAIDCSVSNYRLHMDRSATLPFMSINNLETNVELIAGLDDWESALYMLCWIGTYGFNANLAPSKEVYGKLKIRKWCEGLLDDIVDSKRQDMDSAASFYQLTKALLPYAHVETLQDLTDELRTVLFENPNLGPEFHGALKKPNKLDRKNEIDPVANRKHKERELMALLQEVLDRFARDTKVLRISRN
ncbi:hypothetical protein LPJ73_003458, partial [Coemansia sp. RSA 2703]